MKVNLEWSKDIGNFITSNLVYCLKPIQPVCLKVRLTRLSYGFIIYLINTIETNPTTIINTKLYLKKQIQMCYSKVVSY